MFKIKKCTIEAIDVCFLCKNSSVLIKIILNDNPEKSKLLLALAALLGQLVGKDIYILKWFRRSVHKCSRMDHNDNANEIDIVYSKEVIG